MTDDLVKRLRDLVNDDDTEMLAWDAADRIEQLEAALREIINSARLVGDYHHVKIARAALGEKKDAD
jgi:hypothetical protein